VLERVFSASALTGVEATRANLQSRIQALRTESKRLLGALSANEGAGGRTLVERLGEIETEVDHLRVQLGEVEDRLRAWKSSVRDEEKMARLFDDFDAVWGALAPLEKRELLHLLIDRIVVDLDAGGFRIEFHDLCLAPPLPLSTTGDQSVEVAS
jgi:hypothetical protein